MKFGDRQLVLQVRAKVKTSKFQCPLIMTSTKTFKGRKTA
uniref:Uncharacterized protein n=1 Tax=Arundo donax TaxID=35708 RepID=A0A0A9AE37_ARUDO